jgi:hypothetical protein
MKFVLIAAMMFATSTVVAAEQLTIAQIIEMGVAGDPNPQIGREYRVKYWIQPCSQKFANLAVTDIPPYASSADNKAVAVVVVDSGLDCAGPTIQELARFTLQGPGPVGGTKLHPVQPK